MMKPAMLQELSRLFDLEAQDAIVNRIVNGRPALPAEEEIREHQRLSKIASELRHRADASIALRILGIRL